MSKRDRRGTPKWQENRGHKTIFERKRMVKAGEQEIEEKVPQPIINSFSDYLSLSSNKTTE